MTTLILLAVYFFRESSRESREALQRVSFVNRVSHELKTPLTNIRLYAELLDEELGEEEVEPRNYLSVIVSESQRLSRLIGNVLTFARKQRGQLRIRPRLGNVDERVSAVVESFRPLLADRGVEIDLALDAGPPARFDGDVLEQILANLFSNVEKYAASGGFMRVETSRKGETTTIHVSDRGPGIPEGMRSRIFEPFRRLSEDLVESASGTGIGLTIARELARLHGGDLVAVTPSDGLTMRVTLRTATDEIETGGGEPD